MVRREGKRWCENLINVSAVNDGLSPDKCVNRPRKSILKLDPLLNDLSTHESAEC